LRGGLPMQPQRVVVQAFDARYADRWLCCRYRGLEQPLALVGEYDRLRTLWDLGGQEERERPRLVMRALEDHRDRNFLDRGLAVAEEDDAQGAGDGGAGLGIGEVMRVPHIEMAGSAVRADRSRDLQQALPWRTSAQLCGRLISTCEPACEWIKPIPLVAF